MSLGQRKLKQLQYERFNDILEDAQLTKKKNSKLIYVDSATGNDDYSGTRIVSPIDTLDHGINAASAHDSIRVLPSHGETISAASQITIDVNGLDILGLGQGTYKPLFTYSNTAGTIVISANNVSFKNFAFLPSVDSVVSPLVVTGNDSDIEIDIKDASDTVEFVKGITYNGCTKGKLKLNYYGRTGGNACTHAILMTDCHRFEIEVHFYGKASTSMVEFLTTSCTDIKVNGWYHNDGTSNFTKTVVDTAGSSKWSWSGWDNVFGGWCSGGNAAAIAGDDVSAVATAVSSLQTDLGNPSARTNLQTIEAMLGNPDTAGATIYAAIGGAAGLVSYPAAQPAGDGISMAEVIRYIQESQFGTLVNTGGTATMGGILGDFANTSAVTRFANIQTEVDKIGTVVNTGGTATLAAILGDFANVSLITKLGTFTNTGGTASIGAILGDVANVSVAARLIAIQAETDLVGTIVNTGGTATIGGVLGDFANVSAVTRFANIQTEVDKIGTIVNTGGTATLAGILGDFANVTAVTKFANIQTEVDKIGTIVNTGGTATLAGILGDFANVTAVTKFANIQTEVDKIGTLVNTGGTATLGAILGDFANVSLITKLGTFTNTGGTASIGAILGDVANVSIATRLIDLGSGVTTLNTKIGTPVNTGGTAAIGAILGDFANVTAVTKFANIQTEVDKIGTVVNTGGTATLAGILGDFANVTAVTKFANIQTEVDKIGTLVNTGGTATLGGMIGDPANVSIISRLTTLSDVLSGTSGIASFPAAAEAADTVSIAEVLRWIHERQVSKTEIKTYADLTGFDTAVAFTVTGAVRVRVYGVTGATQIQCTSGTSTLAVGTSSDSAALIPATIMNNAGNFVAGSVWIDASPTSDVEAYPNNWFVLGGGSDIYLTRNVDDITQGVLELYCEWIPLSANGDVTAA